MAWAQPSHVPGTHTMFPIPSPAGKPNMPYITMTRPRLACVSPTPASPGQ